MANEKLIRKIQKGFGAVYEMGDDALDALTTMPHYRKWLDTGMTDAHVDGLDKRDLQKLYEEIESVLLDLAW